METKNINTFKIISNSLEDTKKIGFAIAKVFENKGGLISMFGDVGAGKTALTKFIGSALGVEERITSPSFVILNEYHSGKLSLYHFDLYRLENEGLDTIMGEIDEYTEGKNALAVVEWSEFSNGSLPKEHLKLQISYLDEEAREFEFSCDEKYLNYVEIFENLKRSLV